jgi:hypothetical protein
MSSSRGWFRPLEIQSRVYAAIFVVVVSAPLDYLIRVREQILLPVRLLWDRVAPVGRNEPVVCIVHAECGSQAADHASGSVRTALLLVDAFYEHVVRRRVIRELQHDLVRPVMHRVCELLVRLGALLVRPDLDLGVELSPELEVDLCHLEMANNVPRNERVVELFSRVEGGEKLRLGEGVHVYVVNHGGRNGDPELYART